MRCAFGLYRTVLVDADRTPYDGGKILHSNGSDFRHCLSVPDHCGRSTGRAGTSGYSVQIFNKILLVEDTETPGTIYKRVCDVEMSDMLANGLESNSYYQLMTDTFAKPGDTELTEVSYVDSTNLVPGIVYFPSALGLSVGRVCGFSAMLTLQLARIFNLICLFF